MKPPLRIPMLPRLIYLLPTLAFEEG